MSKAAFLLANPVSEWVGNDPADDQVTRTRGLEMTFFENKVTR